MVVMVVVVVVFILVFSSLCCCCFGEWGWDFVSLFFDLDLQVIVPDCLAPAKSIRVLFTFTFWSSVMVQTPGLDEGNVNIARNAEMWANVTVPRGLNTMVSFTFLHLPTFYPGRCNDAVHLFKGSKNAEDKLLTSCGLTPPAPQLLESDVYHVHFKRGRIARERFDGFQLHFSFHKVI